MKRMVGKLVGGGMCILTIPEIMMIKSDMYIQRIFLRHGDIVAIRRTLCSLKEELERLAPGQFAGVSKGIVVNILAIEAIHADHVVVSGGHEVPLARRRYRKFQEQVLAYIQ